MNKTLSLTIGHLYGSLMNTYGDDGNIIALKKRCEWRGIKVTVKEISLGDKIKKGECNLYFFGGGQDQAQITISEDLINNKGKTLEAELERGVPILAICGGYQLLGAYYEPQKGPKIAGLGFLPVFTRGSDSRMIGNIIVEVKQLISESVNQSSKQPTNRSTESLLIGFENHSGKTYLQDGAKPLGKVIKGFGNNGQDGSEGCVKNNAIGCYMHGSLLPKNPVLADWLISKALEVKYGKKVELERLDDSLEMSAHVSVISRFR